MWGAGKGTSPLLGVVASRICGGEQVTGDRPRPASASRPLRAPWTQPPRPGVAPHPVPPRSPHSPQDTATSPLSGRGEWWRLFCGAGRGGERRQLRHSHSMPRTPGSPGSGVGSREGGANGMGQRPALCGLSPGAGSGARARAEWVGGSARGAVPRSQCGWGEESQRGRGKLLEGDTEGVEGKNTQSEYLSLPNTRDKSRMHL